VHGARAHRSDHAARDLLVLGVLVPTTTVLLAAAPSLGVMLVLAPLSGLGLAPFSSTEMRLTAIAVPAERLTEAFTWVHTMTVMGVAGGSALAGVVVSAGGWRASIVVGCAIGALGGVVVATRRATLAGHDR